MRYHVRLSNAMCYHERMSNEMRYRVRLTNEMRYQGTCVQRNVLPRVRVSNEMRYHVRMSNEMCYHVPLVTTACRRQYGDNGLSPTIHHQHVLQHKQNDVCVPGHNSDLTTISTSCGATTRAFVSRTQKCLNLRRKTRSLGDNGLSPTDHCRQGIPRRTYTW